MAQVRLRLDANSEAEAVARAADALRAGGVAFLPAEGLYGLHALATSSQAIERLRRIKSRAPGKGYIGLIAEPEEIDAWAEPEPAARELVRKHWPGALTLVLRASASVPESLRAADGTVALRCPGSAFLRAVIAAAGGLVISTSANPPGGAPAVRSDDAPGNCDLVVDAGTLSGIPSTVARISVGGIVELLREGAVRLPGGGHMPGGGP